ncbi:glycosyltransferase family 4 protein [Patescibacteria group bacterium]|nr:glycosyltransferase family 4 protein [Patescibacteria group bacterium]MBU1613136.1 glycosyltransferase family 4 protein [Patescibacteria group bacterium]
MIIGIEAAHANKIQRTGVENVCFALIQGLKQVIPSDVRVVLYSNTQLQGGLENLPSNWQAKILSWPLGKLWSQIRLSFELLLHPPDIFIAPGQLIPFFTPHRTVSIVHDSAFLVYPAVYNFWGRQYLKWMNRRVVGASELIITPSEFSKSELIKFYKINPEKIKVIPLGYNKELFRVLSDEEKKSTPAILRKLNISEPYVLSINRLEEKKNTLGIVRAFNLLRKEIDCQLVLVGKPGVGYGAIKQAMDESEFTADIIEPGWVEDSELPHLLGAAKVFLVPSLYEGFGLPVLQAFAVGCPVVASDRTSLPEVSQNAAMLVEPENVNEIASATKKFINDEPFRHEKIAAGLEIAKNYSWDKFCSEFYSVIAKNA